MYASPDKFSSSWDEEREVWKTYRPSVLVEDVPNSTNLIGINPITGPTRKDSAVTAFRSFLVEMDGGTIKEQMEIVKKAEMPFSSCVFSGGKSLHFCITLNQDLPSVEIYRFFSEWILNSMPMADQGTGNPSRGTRYPETKRHDTGRMQKAVILGERISLNKLKGFLAKHPDKVPVEKNHNMDDFEPRDRNPLAADSWFTKGMAEGFDFSIGRNNRWFSIGIQIGKCGYDFNEFAEDMQSKGIFVEEKDFLKSEWMVALKSGYKHGRNKYWNKK